VTHPTDVKETMTMKKDDLPRRRALPAWCAAVAVVVGLSQVVAAEHQLLSPAQTSASVNLQVADARQSVTPNGLLRSFWNWLFGASIPCQDELSCGRKNSPAIDGASIEMPSARLESGSRSLHELNLHVLPNGAS
jgi:hypothetical protein